MTVQKRFSATGQCLSKLTYEIFIGAFINRISGMLDYAFSVD